MALGKADVEKPIEAEIPVTKFFVNVYSTLVDEIKEELGEEAGRQLAYDAYHKAVFNSCAPAWEEMRDKGETDAQAYGEWLLTDLMQQYEVEIIENTPESFRVSITSCPWADHFLDKGKGDTGNIFCEVDYDMMKDFNRITGADLVFERTKVLMEGCECCNHHIHIKE
jgi:hypothetical protein